MTRHRWRLNLRGRGDVHVPVDKTISIPDVEPFDCTQDFCCCNETSAPHLTGLYYTSGMHHKDKSPGECSIRLTIKSIGAFGGSNST